MIRARQLLERARIIQDKPTGASSRFLVETLLGIGELHLAEGKPAEAVPVLERALALHNAVLGDEIRLTLADAVWRSRGDRARARSLAEETRAAWVRMKYEPGVRQATRWLDEHSLGGR
jgi:serine/threonine-protein kinase